MPAVLADALRTDQVSAMNVGPRSPGIFTAPDDLSFEDADREAAIARAKDRHIADVANLDRARELARADLASAIGQARAVCADFPASPSAAARLLALLVVKGDKDAALDLASTAASLVDSSPDGPASIIIGQSMIYLGSKELARKVLKKAPDVAAARVILAALESEHDEPESALATLVGVETAEADALRGYLLLTLGRHQAALRELRLARGKSLSDPPSLAANMAYAFGALGSQRKACKYALEAAALAPADPELRANLALTLIRDGRHHEAAADLRAWRSSGYPVTNRIWLAEANALSAMGEMRRAYGLLRGAVTDRATVASEVERAELAAYSYFLEYRTGGLTRDSLTSRLRKLFADSERRSVNIVCLLADASYRRSSHPELMRFRAEVAKQVTESDLRPLDARLHAISGNTAAAVAVAMEWVRDAPMDMQAIGSLTTFLTDEDNFEDAARVGLEGLRVAPHAHMIRNNTAYALAMLRRTDEARHVIAPLPFDKDPYVTATRALIDIGSGSLRAGVAGYARACEVARKEWADKDEAEALCALLAVQLRLVLRRLEIPVDGLDLIDTKLIAEKWKDRPDVEVMRQRARRINLDWH